MFCASIRERIRKGPTGALCLSKVQVGLGKLARDVAMGETPERIEVAKARLGLKFDRGNLILLAVEDQREFIDQQYPNRVDAERGAVEPETGWEKRRQSLGVVEEAPCECLIMLFSWRPPIRGMSVNYFVGTLRICNATINAIYE